MWSVYSKYIKCDWWALCVWSISESSVCDIWQHSNVWSVNDECVISEWQHYSVGAARAQCVISECSVCDQLKLCMWSLRAPCTRVWSVSVSAFQCVIREWWVYVCRRSLESNPWTIFLSVWSVSVQFVICEWSLRSVWPFWPVSAQYVLSECSVCDQCISAFQCVIRGWWVYVCRRSLVSNVWSLVLSEWSVSVQFVICEWSLRSVWPVSAHFVISECSVCDQCISAFQCVIREGWDYVCRRSLESNLWSIVLSVWSVSVQFVICEWSLRSVWPLWPVSA